MIKQLYEDAKNICEKDPACRNIFEAIILYPGFHAIFFHRIAHFFYLKKLYFLARNVMVGTGAKVLGPIKIGNNVKFCAKLIL